ncbi:MAG: AAA family ATPase [Chloroflexota bacterium]|jgi:DNA-binding SARP family transcriptional activator
MASLVIRLLGTPEIQFGEQPLSFRTRKVLALLVYLVMERGMHSRESLMALLWPESPASSAAASLRVTLSRLRKGLDTAGDVIISEGGHIGFDADYAMDLDLEWLATAAQPETAPDDLEPILTLDRGEFLEGFALPDAPEFDTWAEIQRQIRQRQLETVYDRLSQHLLATRNNAAAVETAARWVARAPLSEQAYRRLMAAQALNGQRSAALQTYEQLRTTLQQELGLEPGRETAVLADNISRGRVGEDRSGPASGESSRLTGAPGRHLLLPLVGRSEEHSQLVAAFGRTSQEGAQVVAVLGAAGSGKTRLVSAFQEWVSLESPGAEFWQGRAFETGGRLAYQPVVEALRLRVEQVNAPEDLLEDVWLAELSQLMPELRARYPDLPPPLTGDANFVRARLFEAVANLGDALAHRRPAVFVLDDMQWADADTLDLVHYLARRWAELDAPIMVLLTIRQEAYAANASLREWLAKLGRDVTLSRLLLDSLNGAAVQELVEHLSSRPVDEEATTAFSAWLWAETRGLPFFIEALLHMLVKQGILPVIDKDMPTYDFAAALSHVRSMAQVPIPPGVREVIRARLAQHSKDEGALLLAAAVLGRTSTFERLCQVADLSEGDALEALDSLLDGRLLSERPSDRQPYTLAHDYIREVVYTESREARRRVFHRRALLALEAAAAPAAECAFHALAALLDEPAFRFSVAAGSEAFAAYAVQEALAHFDAAREVAQRMHAQGEVTDEELLGLLYRKRGLALELSQEDAAAQANYEEMRQTAVQRGSKTLELSALISQSNLHGHYTGVFDPFKSKELAQAALVLARELGDREAEAGALWGLQVAELYSAGDSKQVVAYGEQALALARELGLKELMGLVLNNLCWPFGAQRRLEEVRAILLEAQAIWRELGNLPRLAEASRFMLIIHSLTGDHGSMLVDAPKLTELGAAIGSRLDEVESLLWLASVHARQGRFGQALNYLEQYGQYAESLGHTNEKHGHQYGRIRIYRTVGALIESEHWADQLYAERGNVPPNFTTQYFVEIARVKIARGKLEEGRAILDEMLAALPFDAVWSFNIIDIALGYGELNLALNQPADLFAGLEERLRPYREAGFLYYLAVEQWLRGRANLALSHYDLAREALQQAIDAAEAQEERAVLWQILASLAEVEDACGNTELAERVRERAREVVSFIAEHAGEMRESFLARPEVQAVLMPY